MSISLDSGPTQVKMSGQLDASAVRAYEREILTAIQRGKLVEIDVSQVSSATSLGLRLLLVLLRTLSCQGKSLTVSGLSPALLETLDAVGFLHLSRECLLQPADSSMPLGASLGARVDIYPSHSIAGYPVRQGSPIPFGARAIAGGVNFSIHSAHATGCTLVLYDRDQVEPVAEIEIPEDFRIGNVYCIFVFGLDPDRLEYGYRFQGPYRVAEGHRFDPSQVVIDPFARLIRGRDRWGERNGSAHYRSRLAPADFDWEEESSPRHAMEDLVIYEMHVRGFTRHESSQTRWPGTFAGIREKIPYLKELGVNCVELMPIFEFDELDNPRHNPTTGEPLVNYWGYNTVGFFAPKAGYASTGTLGMQSDEFKALVKELHRNGIEIFLDVVFNHTAEGNEFGPTISFRGIDNKTYYMLGRNGEYLNYSGTGNTLNCNHPVVRDMVIDSLRYWVSHYHIDGFRFDLASILGRSPTGEPLANPPLLEALAHDPVLARCKLIAEAWDAAGLYQVGSFPSYGRWAEWNGKFRDSIRKFLKGEAGIAGEVAQRMLGSPDLYANRGPAASVNYVTCHDGFTLADLVSYNDKHNEANGESNQDGTNTNDSWNCGVEGPSDDPAIQKLRHRQIKNAWAMLMTSQGVPMILMGDELGRTQQGNNNAYCHDGPINWLDWGMIEKNAEIWNFARQMIAFRREHPALRHSLHVAEQGVHTRPLEISWHGVVPGRPDWSFGSRSLAFELRLADHGDPEDTLYLAFNMFWEPLSFLLPAAPAGRRWHLFANTGLPAPNDIVEPGEEKPLADPRLLLVRDRSIVILVAR